MQEETLKLLTAVTEKRKEGIPLGDAIRLRQQCVGLLWCANPFLSLRTPLPHTHPSCSPPVTPVQADFGVFCSNSSSTRPRTYALDPIVGLLPAFRTVDQLEGRDGSTPSDKHTTHRHIT